MIFFLTVKSFSSKVFAFTVLASKCLYLLFFSKYLLSISYIPGNFLGTKNIAVHRTDRPHNNEFRSLRCEGRWTESREAIKEIISDSGKSWESSKVRLLW